jgi:hypothetical protein
MLPNVPPRSYFGPIRTELRYAFIAPTFIDSHTNTKTPEEPRYCYYPVRLYKAYQQSSPLLGRLVRG